MPNPGRLAAQLGLPRGPAAGLARRPYKGLASYYSIGHAHRAAWSYRKAYPEVGRIADLVSFEPDKVSAQLDDLQLRSRAGPDRDPHGADRDLSVGQAIPAKQP
jgi:hypothetical protein